MFHISIITSITINPEEWMKESMYLISNYTLLDISLPGTHDSGAYIFSKEIGTVRYHNKDLTEIINQLVHYDFKIYNIIRPLAITQTYTIYEQLIKGIRYLDLRVFWNGYDWYIHHTMKGLNIRIILQQIQQFLQTHTSEILFIDVSHIRSYSQPSMNITTLFDIFEFYFNDLFIPGNTTLESTTIASLINQNHRILINIDDYNEVIKRTNFFYYWSTIEGSYAEANTLDKMIDYNNKQLNEKGGHSVFFQTSFTLTPSMIDNVFTFIPCTPYENLLNYTSQTGHHVIQNWFNTIKNQHPGNIVMVDNLEYVDVVTPLLQRIERNCYDHYKYIARQDNRQDCRSRKEDGYCNNSTSMYSFMTLNCRLTCGFC